MTAPRRARRWMPAWWTYLIGFAIGVPAGVLLFWFVVRPLIQVAP